MPLESTETAPCGRSVAVTLLLRRGLGVGVGGRERVVQPRRPARGACPRCQTPRNWTGRGFAWRWGEAARGVRRLVIVEALSSRCLLKVSDTS